jgi:hypothetical protein
MVRFDASGKRGRTIVSEGSSEVKWQPGICAGIDLPISLWHWRVTMPKGERNDPAEILGDVRRLEAAGQIQVTSNKARHRAGLRAVPGVAGAAGVSNAVVCWPGSPRLVRLGALSLRGFAGAVFDGKVKRPRLRAPRPPWF